MKILHLETGKHLYGGALQVAYLIKGLNRLGLENTLVCDRQSAIGRYLKDQCRCLPISVGGDMDARVLWQLANIIRREKPSLLHVHSRRGADLWGALAAALTGIPAVVSRRVDNPEPAWWARFKYQRFRHVITISEGIRRVMTAEGVPAEHITCVPSAVDAQAYQQPCDSRWFHDDFGYTGEDKVFAVIAQLISRKGHHVLLEALPAIVEKCPNIKFLFLGKGPLFESLSHSIQNKHWAQVVHLAGFRDDLNRILPCLHGVVHPALMEGLGVSLLQAAAAGLPIIASDVGGIPEIIIHEQTGLLIPPQQPQAIVDAVTRLYHDGELAKSLGENASRRVDDHFSLQAMVKGNVEVYKRVCSMGQAV